MANQRRSGTPLHQTYVPEEFKRALEDVAKENRRPPTEEIRLALEKHLAAHGRKLSAVPAPLPPKKAEAAPEGAKSARPPRRRARGAAAGSEN
jgi:hypothetical protein